LNNRWYAALGIPLNDYREHMRNRSERWGTMQLPAEDFRRLARPFDEMM